MIGYSGFYCYLCRVKLKKVIMTNLILSIRPEAFFSFLLVVGILALNIFLIVKFIQIAKDARESKEILGKILREIGEVKRGIK